MSLNPQNIGPGEEQHETFYAGRPRTKRVQYDYRHTDGRLFSCVAPTLEVARIARDAWLEQRKA